MNKPTVLLMFGGESSEHSVSMLSARNVLDAMDKDRYDAELCYIDISGRFWSVDKIDDAKSDTAEEMMPQLGTGTFVTTTGRLIKVDVIFPILHGTNGEDGTVQGMAQLLHIPVVGCDMTASAIAMSKRMAKQIAWSNGVGILAYHIHHRADPTPDYEVLKQDLDELMFVKPDSAGSSIGVNRAHDQETLEAALEEAHKYDDVVLIEKGLDRPRELEVAVFGTYPDIRLSSIAEVKPDSEFYSFDSKYDEKSTSEVVIPAELNEDNAKVVKDMAKFIYYLIGCKGMARVDFLQKADTVYFNEINTIPGFTNISVYPKAWEHEGVGYSELIDMLIANALEK